MLSILFWLVDSILEIALVLVIVSGIVQLLLSFDVLNRRNPTVFKIDDILTRVTEPLYRPVRRVLSPFNGIDLSPLVVILAIQLLRKVLGMLFVQAIMAV